MCSQDWDLFDLQELNANKKRHAYLFQLITSFVSPLFTFFWVPQRAQLSPPPSNHILGTCAASQFLIYISRTNNSSRMVLWYLLYNEEILNYRKLENNPIVNGQWSGDLKTSAPLCTFLPSCVFLKVGDMVKQLLNLALVLLACRKMFDNKRRSPSLTSSSGQYTMFLSPVLFTAVLRCPCSHSKLFSVSHLPQSAMMLSTSFQELFLWYQPHNFFFFFFWSCIYLVYMPITQKLCHGQASVILLPWGRQKVKQTSESGSACTHPCSICQLSALVILFNFSELVSLLVI